MRKNARLIKNHLTKKFADIKAGFNLSRRSDFMHLGLDILLFSIKNYPDFIEEINKLLTKCFDNSRFVLVYPQLVLTVKWKYDYINSRKKRKMANPMNAYVPRFVSNDLKWYDWDGLMTWYNQCKCKDFLRDTNKNFEKAKIVNFDMIHCQCCGEELREDLLKYYQTVNDKSVLQYPTSDQAKILSSAFRTDRDDIFFERKTKKHSLSFKFFLKSRIILLSIYINNCAL